MTETETEPTQPPEPVPEPEEEPSEDQETGLLPNRDRLARMSADERRDLAERVRDWSGPTVERWREIVDEVERAS
jgi:hypothetical protein